MRFVNESGEKARKRNAVCKAKLHDAHKKLFKAADASDAETAAKKFKEFVSGLDKAVKKGIITKNTADRKKSRAHQGLSHSGQGAQRGLRLGRALPGVGQGERGNR